MGCRGIAGARLRRTRCRDGFVVALLILAWSGCGDRSSSQPSYDANRQRRVFQPPPGEVRAVPPHAIRAEGVGPYLLGASLKDILGLLPHGPRVELMEIDRVVDYSLVRTEADSILIGVQRPGVTFVSVLDKEIARTNNGVGVGAKTSELRAAMGAELDGSQLRDPHILRFASLANARFVVERDRVVAVVVEQEDPRFDYTGGDDDDEAGEDGEPEPAAASPAGGEPCPIAGLAAGAVEIVAAAQMDGRDSAEAHVTYGCLSANLAAALVVAGPNMALVAGEPGKFRRLMTQHVDHLAFAGFLDTDGDGKHEVALVTDDVDAKHYRVKVEVQRIENGRFLRLAALDAYEVSAASATWIGAGLDQIEFLLELSARSDTVRIGGLYVHRGKRRPLTVAPLTGKKLVVRRKRVTPPATAVDHDAGVAPLRPRLRPGHEQLDAGPGRGTR